MKNSGIEWIGNIPDSWSLSRLQWHLSEVKESNDPVKTTQVLSLTNKLGVIPYEEKGDHGNKAKENLNEYKLAYPGTIVANSMNILIGSVGKCDYFGCVSPVYYVFKPNDGENIDFLNYVFQTEQFQKELRRYANGILEIRLRVSASDILKRKISFPSADKQKQIVAFLNCKTKEIDDLIQIENNQIGILKELKKSIISKVVFNGLNKSDFKSTDVQWIKCIPAHWDIMKTKSIFEIYAGSTPDSGNQLLWDGTIKWVTPADFKTDDVFVNGGKRNISELGLQSCSTTIIPSGSIIFSKRAPIGSVAISSDELCTNQGCLACVAKMPVYIKYFYYQMSVLTEFYELYGSGTTFKEISAQNFGFFKLAVPPLNEQKEIVDYLDEKCLEISELIKDKISKIDLLENYKKSLVYEYITGKKEVA